MELWIVRHGQTEGNVQGVMMGGGCDYPLTEEGVRQAESLRDNLVDKDFDKILCSSNQRAKDTLEIALSKSYNVQYEDRLKEKSYGNFTNVKKSDVDESVLAEMEGDPYNFRFEGGESFADVVVRSGEFLSDLIKQDYDRVLIITHQNVIRALIANMLNLEEEVLEMEFSNCSVTRIEYDGDGFRIL